VQAIGVSSDLLYPAYQSREIVEAVNAAGGDAEYVELDSPHGHDAFLLEFDQVGEALTKFLHRIENDG
jgi:homoserine O-acetyltransferase